MLGVAFMGSAPRTMGLAWLLAAGAALGGGLFLASTLDFLGESRWPGPAVDFWHFMKLLNKRAAGADWWPLLVREHGGHRLLVPKLLYLVEYSVFEGRNVFLLTLSVLLQGLTAALVTVGVWRERAVVGLPMVVFVGGFVVALLFSGAQAENFLRSWNLHWFLVVFAAAVSFAALVRGARSDGERPVSARWLGVALLAGLVATWSMANGLLVWPVLLGLAWLLRVPRHVWVVLGVVAAAGAASFFVGYEPHANVAPGRLFAEPVAHLLWLARALGTAVSPENGAFAATGGTVLLVCGGLAGWDLVRRRGCLADVELLLAGLFLFGVGTLALAAGGRAASTWNEPRYQTAVLVTWLAFFVWGLQRAGGVAPRWALAAMTMGLVWLVVPVAWGHGRGLEAQRPFAEQMRAANLAIVVGIAHRPSYQVTLPFADRLRERDRVERYAPGLRRRGQGMFADGAHRLLGTRVDLAGTEPCSAPVREVTLLRDPESGRRVGTRLEGTLTPGTPLDSDHPLLVTDAEGQIIGLGRTHHATWTAFARPPTPPTHLLGKLRGRSCIVNLF
jgi:hypothetical protein